MPTSDLRITFNGDDGSVERLATLRTGVPCIDIEIELISSDQSGRSFLIKTSDNIVSYFWCSEKSKLLGDELLRKMKDFLMQKPSLAELTGISDSRLSCFATNLQVYLSGLMISFSQACHIRSVQPSVDLIDHSETQSSCSSSRYNGNQQGSKTNLIYQGNLVPRSSSPNEGLERSFPCVRTAARGKLWWHGESNISRVDNTSLASFDNTNRHGSNCREEEKFPEVNGTQSFPSFNLLDVVEKSAEMLDAGQEIPVSLPGPSLSPHYCWCPPLASALQYSIGNPPLPISLTESFSLPPLSSLLPPVGPSILLSDIPPLDFPSFPPVPLVRLQTSQQIPTFTPLICDPIVHIPVIDVCSSVQGYFVNSGSAMSTIMPPLNSKLSNTESVVEKDARETLRMLINSSNQPNPQLLEALPSVLSCSKDRENILTAGILDAINDMPTIGLALLADGGGIGKRYGREDDLGDDQEKKKRRGFEDGTE